MAILPGQDVLDNVKGSLKDLIPSAHFLYVLLAAGLFSLALVLGKHVLHVRREARVIRTHSRKREACEKGIAGIVEEEEGRPSKLAMISKLIEDISA